MGRKSAKIAARKGAADAAKAKTYTKALKDVYLASKGGSADPAVNFMLNVAIEKAKKYNVPKDNIDKAIKKGQGGDGAGEEVNYEGYGPEGVGIFVETVTDNTTRTVGNVRSYFKKCGGSLGQTGSLEFVFSHKAVYLVPVEGLDEDEFGLEMIDVGAEDVEKDGDFFKVSGPMETYGAINQKLQEMGITPEEGTLTREPLNTKSVSDEAYEQIEKLVSMLEEDDDVVQVYTNLEEEEE